MRNVERALVMSAKFTFLFRRTFLFVKFAVSRPHGSDLTFIYCFCVFSLLPERCLIVIFHYFKDQLCGNVIEP